MLNTFKNKQTSLSIALSAQPDAFVRLLPDANPRPLDPMAKRGI